VRYHHLLGVEKFFIFDHKSARPIEQLLAPMVASGLVTVIRATGQYPQVPLYDWTIKNHQPASEWIAFIDADEFLVPKGVDDLRTLLREYEQFGGLGVHWPMFGSSGHVARPSGLVIENYRLRSPWTYDLNQHVKSIVQPPRTLEPVNPHFFRFKPPWFCVNEQSIPFDGPFSYPVTCRRIQLNHYYFKSREDFARKCSRGIACNPGNHEMKWFDERDPLCNVEADDTIQRFMPQLKRAMGR
jgi:hypothetical protein